MTVQPINTLLDLSGQVALITGANRGIGKATATVLHAAGANLALVARTTEALAAVTAELLARRPASALALPADVADEAPVNSVVEQTLAAWGRIDILVNNAGLVSPGTFDRITPADWQRILNVNLTGAYLCCRAVAPVMQQQRAGRIINISSISAQTGGVSGGVHYAASKGGMLAMTKTLARDLAPYGITVNAIAPGQIDTRPEFLTEQQRQTLEKLIPLGRLGAPEEIAYPVLFLASPMASYLTGATLDVNGGILKR
ncbi:MAG: SDR family oxidoreductase [Caldilineaceae bacterium]|nr:SDR family oxidoreductase [Caldilineaceae bacterium]